MSTWRAIGKAFCITAGGVAIGAALVGGMAYGFLLGLVTADTVEDDTPEGE